MKRYYFTIICCNTSTSYHRAMCDGNNPYDVANRAAIDFSESTLHAEEYGTDASFTVFVFDSFEATKALVKLDGSVTAIPVVRVNSRILGLTDDLVHKDLVNFIDSLYKLGHNRIISDLKSFRRKIGKPVDRAD